jgi:putative restriction endonuclease
MSTSRSDNYGKLWIREELILAFDLYCRIPFQKTNARNPDVQELAALLDRSPASVARKLGNFGAFDPELKKRNIAGLGHGSRLDKEIWGEFHQDWNRLVLLANQLKERSGERTAAPEAVQLPDGPSERLATAKQRIHQSFFREAVLSSYDNRCCITGISVQECLTASHIVPWSVDERYRADPTNGLCLSATFDRLFDAGMITITPEMTVAVSRRIPRESTGANRDLICAYQGSPILLPRRFLPDTTRLAWHRENVFVG